MGKRQSTSEDFTHGMLSAFVLSRAVMGGVLYGNITQQSRGKSAKRLKWSKAFSSNQALSLLVEIVPMMMCPSEMHFLMSVLPELI